MKAEFIAKALGGRKVGSGWMARCPCHDDRQASLKIDEIDDGKILVHCHAGCEQKAVIAALKERGLWPQMAEKPAVARRRIVEMYDYCGADGDLLFQVVRFAPKDFRQRRPDGKGGWIWNMQGVGLVPYRLPDVVAAREKGETIWIVEGEKDVEAVRGHGLVGTCNPGGAGKWREEFVKYFADAKVAIAPDNDAAGNAHAEQIAASLLSVAAWVRIVSLPNLPPKGDVSDWISRGGTVDDIHKLCEAATEWMPTNEGPTGESADTDDSLAEAKAVIVDLASRAKKDPGVPFEAEALRAQATIRHHSCPK